MARSVLAIQDVVAAGLDPTYTAADAAGHQIVNDGKTILHVKNGATAVVVTVQTPFTQDGLDLDELEVTVPDSEERMIGPFEPRSFNIRSGADSGQVYIDFDDITNVTIAAVRVP